MRPLDQRICLTLYATSMAVTRAYKPLLDQLGLTCPRYLVLSALGEAGSLPVGIAARRDLEPSTVTPLLKRLETAGLVKRMRGVEDERRVDVTMTDAGWALLKRSACLGTLMVERSAMTGDETVNEKSAGDSQRSQKIKTRLITWH